MSYDHLRESLGIPVTEAKGMTEPQKKAWIALLTKIWDVGDLNKAYPLDKKKAQSLKKAGLVYLGDDVERSQWNKVVAVLRSVRLTPEGKKKAEADLKKIGSTAPYKADKEGLL